MKPGTLPIEIYRGDSLAWQFNLWDDEAKTIPTDLSAAEVKAQIRDRPSGKLIVELDCTVTPPNVIDMRLPASVSRTLCITRGAWDLQVTRPDPVVGQLVQTVVAGPVTVVLDITDSDLPAVAPAVAA